MSATPQPELPPTTDGYRAPEDRRCRWCGAAGAHEFELEKARYRVDRGVRVVARRALTALACDACRSHFQLVKPEGREGQAALK